MKKTTIFLTTLAIASLALVGCGGDLPQEVEANTTGPQIIKIGSSGPLSGDVAWLGETILNGIKMGLEEESNEEFTFEVVAEDDQCDPKQAINAYNKLKSSGIVAMAGPECSAATLAVTPIAEQNKMIIMSPSATNADIADAGDFVFRIPASDAFAGVIAAEFMYKDLGYTKVGINAKNDAWGQGLSEVFEKRFVELGGEITANERHEANATDMKTQLTKIKNSGAEALYAPTFPPELIITVKQMQELGMNEWKIIGGDAANDKLVAEALGDAAENIIITAPPISTGAEGDKFRAAYLEKYDKEPQAFAAEGYDTGRILAQAIKAVGTNSEDIRDYLYAVEGYPGASGTITFDEKGESIAKEVALYTFKNGEAIEYTPEN